MALTATGQGALVHDPETRALLLEAASWSLVSDPRESGEPGTADLADARICVGTPVPEWAAVRLVLPWGPRFMVVNGTLRSGFMEGQYTVALTSLPIPDADALDDWESPVDNELQLLPEPDRETWRVRKYPRRKRLAQWQALLREHGATAESWHELLAAYDGGWTLDHPSPAEMPDAGGWDTAPRAAVESVGDFLAYAAATMLDDRLPAEERAA